MKTTTSMSTAKRKVIKVTIDRSCNTNTCRRVFGVSVIDIHIIFTSSTTRTNADSGSTCWGGILISIILNKNKIILQDRSYRVGARRQGRKPLPVGKSTKAPPITMYASQKTSVFRANRNKDRKTPNTIHAPCEMQLSHHQTTYDPYKRR